MSPIRQLVLKLQLLLNRTISPRLKRLLPRAAWLALRWLAPFRVPDTAIRDAYVRDWRTARKNAPENLRLDNLRSGINLIGYLRAVKGISEAARGSLRALTAVEIPCSIIDYELDIPARQRTEPLPDPLPGIGFKFNTNLIHVNPPQLPFLWGAFRRSELTGRYNIGVWYWELPVFPDEWSFAFDLVDEVWVGSQFVFDSISAKSPVPVQKIPPCIDPVCDDHLKRSDYGLPDGRFLFLCAYDVLSEQVRKNPLGAVHAFQRAFPEDDRRVGLVIKINNAAENQDEVRRLRGELKGHSNCYFIEQILDRSSMNSLTRAIDVYVSLHRSEGFGLIPAEAMALGKPVVMTRWSGNLDLMTADNSCGVDYKLVPIKQNTGPYPAGQLWAEPDLDHAAFFMQRLYSDASYYRRISEHAARFIADHFSDQAVGKIMRNRLRDLGVL